ncbi:MAG: hypothetical protein FK733_00860 [Asgard group archaeon]|nr:hypothetical protein [Asgard group archaeon]
MDSKKITSFLIAICILVPWILFPFQTENVKADCPPWAISSPKTNSLYIYFPSSSDAVFPEYGIYGASTSPVPAFDVNDLDGTIGTSVELRDLIFDMVVEDYCEFNVDVIEATSLPSPTEDRWQIVAVGTDSETVTIDFTLYYAFGLAQDVDIGDADAQDYGRVWAGSFLDAFGGAGEALNGADSTLERWATTIGETTAHEAGHNYGLRHEDADPIPGEDTTINHIMATGDTLTGEDRASLDRHFSDTSYEILAYNLGLNVETLHNWDFINPNDEDAHALRFKILSEADSLSIGWYYQGIWSPWTGPTMTKLPGTEVFQGDSYNVFQCNLETAKSWTAGPDGIAPPGVKVHVGISVNEPEPIIIRETKFLDGDGAELPLSGRLMGYDAGTADLATGDFLLSFFAPEDNETGDMTLQNLEVFFVPRMIDIETMLDGVTPMGLNGLPIFYNKNQTEFKDETVRDKVSIPIAHFTDARFVDNFYDCEDSLDIDGGALAYCPYGTQLSLFPSTYVYVMASVVDPNAYYYDQQQAKFVTGPLESKIFYQFSGIMPDFNDNGVDDLLDIRFGESNDTNENGIPDEAERTPLFATDHFASLIAFTTVLILAVTIKRREN